MPLTFGDLAGLVTKAPEERYGFQAGSGMREAQRNASARDLGIGQLRMKQAALNQKSAQVDQKRMDALAKLWREASLSGDPDQIEAASQELERNGFKVHRPDNPDAAEVTSPVSDAAKPTEPQPASGGTFSSLPGFFTPNKPAAPPEESVADLENRLITTGSLAPPDDEAPPPEEEPQASAVPSPEKKPETRATKARGWQVLGPGGQPVFSVSEEQVLEGQRNRVADHFATLKGSARNPGEGRAATIGEKVATAALGKMPLKDALEAGQKAYEFEIRAELGHERSMAVDSAGRAQAAALREKRFDAHLNEASFQQIENIVKDEQMRDSIQKARDAISAGDKATALAGSKNALAQRSALSAQLKQMFSSVTSDRELAYAQNSAGLWSRIQTALNQLDSGQLSDDMLRNMLQTAAETKAALSKRIHAYGVAAQQRVLHHPTFASGDEDLRRRAAAYAYGVVTQDWSGYDSLSGAPQSQGGASAPSKQAAPAAPKVSKSDRIKALK
jgi:hypothetical protein